MFVPTNKKKVLNRIEKFFFSYKDMDHGSDMGYIRSFTHNAELQETRSTVEKPSKKRQKQGFSDLSPERVDGIQKFFLLCVGIHLRRVM